MENNYNTKSAVPKRRKNQLRDGQNNKSPRQQILRLAAVGYEHFRWFCPSNLFVSATKKSSADYFTFVTKPNGNKLQIFVRTPVRRTGLHYNKMEVDKDLIVDITFDGEIVYLWRQRVKFEPRNYSLKIAQTVGTALRICGVARLKDKEGLFYQLQSRDRKQFFVASDNSELPIPRFF